MYTEVNCLSIHVTQQNTEENSEINFSKPHYVKETAGDFLKVVFVFEKRFFTRFEHFCYYFFMRSI